MPIIFRIGSVFYLSEFIMQISTIKRQSNFSLHKLESAYHISSNINPLFNRSPVVSIRGNTVSIIG